MELLKLDIKMFVSAEQFASHAKKHQQNAIECNIDNISSISAVNNITRFETSRKYIHSYKYVNKQINKQVNKQINKQIDKQINKQMNK